MARCGRVPALGTAGKMVCGLSLHNRFGVPSLVALALVATASALPPAAWAGHPLPLVDLNTGVRTTRVSPAGAAGADLAVADRVLVGLQSGRSAVSTASSSLAAVGGTVARSVGRGRLLVVGLPAGSDVLAVARRLSGRAGVQFAEPDRVVYPAEIPTDSEYANQPHLPRISCPAAWDIGTGSPNVIIAIVDSGVDVDHPDLVDRIWTNTDEIDGNGIDDDGNGYIDDRHGWNFLDSNNDVSPVPDGIDQNSDGEPDEQVNHGTLVAGLAAASANNWGTVGVSWTSTIMPLRVFPDDGTTYVSTVVEAMYYAVENGAHIMNLSIGAGYETSFTGPIEDLWQKGGLTVAAAGNERREFTDSSSSWLSPACNNGPDPLSDNMVLGVGGVNLSDQKASWSNYDSSTAGTFVEVFAPGVNVRGTGVYYPSIAEFATYFTSNSGTSFSAPIVSGLAALLKAQDMGRTGAQLMSLICQGCDAIDGSNPGYVGKLGFGRVNAARSMGADLGLAAPTQVKATDTKGDLGGSITVTWTKSADDGAGGNSVTGYVVSRAYDTSTAVSASAVQLSAWTDLKTVAKGSVQYVDATTTDGVKYYYRVAAIDGTHRSESDQVGPVQSYDDQAPPQVTTLTAIDHPEDSGGAIDLDWTGYAGSSDVAGFRVYRETRTFATVADKDPYAELVGKTARTFTDTATVDGADYYYAVTAVDGTGNEREDVLDAGPVQSFANGSISFPAGVQMVGPPIIPTDLHPATLFGIDRSQLQYARYNTTTGTYDKYTADPLPTNLRLKLGAGFFIKLPHAVQVTPSGSSAPSGDFDVVLKKGWQQLGNPFFGALDFSASTVTVGGNTMDLSSAEAAGYLRAYCWVYNRTTGDYNLVHPQYGAVSSVPAWGGMWVYALKGCTLTLHRPTGTATGSGGAVGLLSTSGDEWVVQLVARGASGADTFNYCGVRASGSGILSPPAAAARPELTFGSGPASVATAFSAAAQAELGWSMELRWPAGEGTVEVLWPDLSTVPREYSLTLCDLDTGKRVSMRHQTGYALDTNGEEGVRHLRVEATKSSGAGVRIASVSAQSTGTGAQVAFSLTAAASCEVSVVNIAGRPIRTVETGRLRAAGANVVLWDGRGETGTSVPRGTYLVRVTAKADDGTVASALSPLRLTR